MLGIFVENHPTRFFTNTISTIGNHVQMLFRYLNRNVKLTVSYVVAFFCMITKYHLMLIQLLIINPMNAVMNKLEQFHGYVIGFRDAIGHIILLLMMILVIHEIILIPLRIKEFDNRK